MEITHPMIKDGKVERSQDPAIEMQRQLWIRDTGDNMRDNASSLPDELIKGFILLVRVAEQEPDTYIKRWGQSIVESILQIQLTRQLVEAGEASIESKSIKKKLAQELSSTGPLSVDKTNIAYNSSTDLPDNRISRCILQHPGLMHAATAMPLMAAFTGVGLLGAAGGFALGQEGVRAASLTSDNLRKVQDLVAYTWGTFTNSDGTMPHMEDFVSRLYLVSTVQFPEPSTLAQIVEIPPTWKAGDLRRKKAS